MKCENCQADAGANAQRCSQCGARLERDLHNELRLINDLIASLAKKDNSKSSVNRLLAQNLKRKDQILSLLMEDSPSRRIEVEEVRMASDVHVPTVQLGDAQDVTADLAHDITVKMEPPGESEPASSALPGAAPTAKLPPQSGPASEAPTAPRLPPPATGPIAPRTRRAMAQGAGPTRGRTGRGFREPTG